MAQASQRIAKLTIETPADLQGVRIELDGRALPPALIGVATMVDPGTHAARLLRGDTELDRKEIDLGAGQSATLSLQPQAPSPRVVAESAMHSEAHTAVAIAPAHDSGRADQDASARKKRLWWGVGAGAAAVVAGAVITSVLLAHRPKDPKPYNGDFEPRSVSVKVNP